MKNNHFRGMGTVFRFTVTQHYKALSVKILLLVLAVVGFAAIPLLHLVFDDDMDTSSTTPITRLYIRNETGLPFDTTLLKENEMYSEVEIVETESSDESFSSMLLENDTHAALTLSLDEQLGMVQIRALYSENSKISESDLRRTASEATEILHQSILQTFDVSQQQLDILNAKTSAEVQTVSDYHSDGQVTNANTHYAVNFTYSYFIVILGALAMSYIFAHCIEEKNSKLVESLLVSIDPTALLVGKILGVTVFLFVGIGVLIGSFFISFLIAKSQGSTEFLNEALDKFGVLDILQSISLSDGILLVVSVLLGYSIIALISGVFGSLCSKNEDIQQASWGVIGFILIGYFCASFSPLFESDSVNITLSLFPLTSIFVAPSNYVCGKITLPVLLAGFALQGGCIWYLTGLVGRVYRMMMLYRGTIPTPKRLFAMLRENRQAEKGGK